MFSSLKGNIAALLIIASGLVAVSAAPAGENAVEAYNDLGDLNVVNEYALPSSKASKIEAYALEDSSNPNWASFAVEANADYTPDEEILLPHPHPHRRKRRGRKRHGRKRRGRKRRGRKLHGRKLHGHLVEVNGAVTDCQQSIVADKAPMDQVEIGDAVEAVEDEFIPVEDISADEDETEWLPEADEIHYFYD